jgi:hypothetical protein
VMHGDHDNRVTCFQSPHKSATSPHVWYLSVLAVMPLARSGIDVVRNKIKMFAQKKVTLPPGRHKIVILDEADRCVVYVGVVYACAYVYVYECYVRVCVCACVCACVLAGLVRHHALSLVIEAHRSMPFVLQCSIANH